MKMVNMTQPAQNILSAFDAKDSQSASILLETFHDENYILAFWTISKGDIIKQNRYKIIDDPRKYPKATIGDAMAITCMQAVREAMEMGGLKIDLTYSDFEMLDEVAHEVCLGKPEDNSKCALCTFLQEAIDNGVRFLLINDGSPDLPNMLLG